MKPFSAALIAAAGFTAMVRLIESNNESAAAGIAALTLMLALAMIGSDRPKPPTT